MTTSKVGKSPTEIKVVFDPGDVEEFPLEQLLNELGLQLQAFATSAGMIIMQSIMRAEEEFLAGKRRSRGTAITRWCKERGSVMVGGQRVPVERHRLRTRAGKEVRMQSYTTFHPHDDRMRAAYHRMLAGVSCRHYRHTVEDLAEACGISKSVMRREIIEATEADLKALCERDLSGFDIRVVVIDGMPLDGQMTIAALGVDASGKKHLLGFREGATENAEVCKRLLEDLAGRHLAMDHATLIIIDGSKALRKAVAEFYGVSGVVHRCQFHKAENLKKHLTHQYQAEYVQKLQTSYGMTHYDDAHRALAALVQEVRRISPSAAGSLQEGFEETLTVHRLGVPDVLRTSFSTTNLIESTFSVAETVMHNVKRWRNALQRLRWCATAFLRAEKQFRRVRGYKAMPVLLVALDNEVRKRRGEFTTEVA